MTRVFDRDLEAAGIPKHDHRGRVADVHSLRVTFISGLAAAGVPLATAQILARHSDPKLTANVYTDPHMLDLRGAVESIPVHRQEEIRIAAQAGDSDPEEWPLNRPRFEGKTCHFPASSGLILSNSQATKVAQQIDENTQENTVLQGKSKEEDGAGHGVRTRDIQLGKLALYQLS